MPLLPPTLAPFITLPVTLHDLLPLPHFGCLASGYYYLKKKKITINFYVELVENGPSQELLALSHEYNTSTTLQPLLYKCPNKTTLRMTVAGNIEGPLFPPVSCPPSFLWLITSLREREVEKAEACREANVLTCSEQNYKTQEESRQVEECHYGAEFR